jgi:protocatechuate 3,4-dioxygenase beta subunit
VTAFVASRREETVAEQTEEVKAPYHKAGFHHPRRANLLGTPFTVAGRVVDLTGQIMAGIKVHAVDYDSPPDWLATEPDKRAHTLTDSRGEFEFEVRPPASLRVSDQRYATVYGVNVFAREEEAPAVLVVAPRVELAGVIVNEFGEGILTATITHLVPRRLYDVPGDDLARSSLIRRSAASGELGRFKFEDMVDLPTSEFYIQAQGYEDSKLKFPAGGDANLRIVLALAAPGPEMITGTVRHENGEPAPDAWVSAGNLSVQTDGAGHFALDLTPGGHQHAEKTADVLEVKAVLRGFLPAKVNAPSVKETEESGERKPLELVLGGPCLSIQGRVVDAAGAPIWGLKIRVIEAENFGLIQKEYGRANRQTLEDMMGGGHTTTDSQGAFRLNGLLDREYRIEILQTRTLLCETSEPVAAGSSDVELVLDLGALQTVAGTIVDRHGAPIAGVTIAVSRKWPGSLEIGNQTVTDLDGTFRIEKATPDPVYLRIEGAPVVTNLFYELPDDADLQNLEVLAARRCEIQFEFGDWRDRAQTVMAVDAFGEQVEMMYEQGNVIGVRPTVQLGSGYSDVFLLGDTASHIVLLSGEADVARYPIVLTPGEIFILRL